LAEEDKTYEVKDKRRVKADGTLKEEPASEAAPAEEQAQDQETEQPSEETPAQETTSPGEPPQADLPLPTVYDLLQFVTGMIAEQAWVRMGLRLAPGQKETEKDLAQAKIAIDTVVFISDKLHAHISEDDRRALRALISDLQVNFVRQST